MTAPRASALVALLASLSGGAGVALAAAAAHKVQSPALAAAAQMLMVHGAAGLALALAAREPGRCWPWLAAAGLVVGGSMLFAAAVALPILTSFALMPGLAPIGGTTVIVGWAVAALAAAWRLFEHQRP